MVAKVLVGTRCGLFDALMMAAFEKVKDDTKEPLGFRHEAVALIRLINDTVSKEVPWATVAVRALRIASSKFAFELQEDPMTSPEAPKIVFIVGSLRKQSFNRQLAEEARKVIGARADTSIMPWADVPVLNQDEEFPTPASVQRVREAVADADGLWIVTPEYNHGLPGGLKNLIDWLSRPLEDGSPGVILGKTVTYSAFSGSSCGRYVLAALIPTFDFLQLKVIAEPPTSGGFDRQQYESNVLRITDTMRADISRQADALLAQISS